LLGECDQGVQYLGLMLNRFVRKVANPRNVGDLVATKLTLKQVGWEDPAK
jgi:hypothetical protein